MCAVLSLTDCAVATSAGGAQGADTVPDRTPRWATELASLTVIAPDLAVAEATAAAALVMGRDGIAWADTQPGCLVFAVTADGLLQRSIDANDLIEHL